MHDHQHGDRAGVDVGQGGGQWHHGATATAIDWTLSAAGPATITGVTGDMTITAAEVPVGTYTLTETNGPTGYTPSDWVCVGGGSANGPSMGSFYQAVTCTITNTAIVPTRSPWSRRSTTATGRGRPRPQSGP